MTLSDLLGGAIVAVMSCDPTPEQDTAVEDAYVAFVAGRITRDEFFVIAEGRAKDLRTSSANRLPHRQGCDLR